MSGQPWSTWDEDSTLLHPSRQQLSGGKVRWYTLDRSRTCSGDRSSFRKRPKTYLVASQYPYEVSRHCLRGRFNISNFSTENWGDLDRKASGAQAVKADRGVQIGVYIGLVEVEYILCKRVLECSWWHGHSLIEREGAGRDIVLAEQASVLASAGRIEPVGSQ